MFKEYLGNSRFIHNNLIGEIEYNRRIANIFHSSAPYVNNKYMESIFNYLRQWYHFINDLDIKTMQACYKPVLQAYDNFFKRGFGHPKFKKKYHSSQSVKINNINNRIHVKKGKLYWKPLGWINLKGYRPEITGKIKHIRIQLKNSQWFIIIVYDSPLPEHLPKTGKEVGIDLGVKTLATLSDSKAKATLKLNEIDAKIQKTQKTQVFEDSWEKAGEEILFQKDKLIFSQQELIRLKKLLIVCPPPLEYRRIVRKKYNSSNIC